jgi:hypothetical protein
MHDLFNDLLGVPFEWYGRGPTAYDCIGLCEEVYKRIGINAPTYISTENLSEVSKAFENATNYDGWEELKKPEPFCLVLMSLKRPYTTHCGVVFEDLVHFIHVLPKRCVAIERLDKLLWSSRIVGYRKYIGNNKTT